MGLQPLNFLHLLTNFLGHPSVIRFKGGNLGGIPTRALENLCCEQVGEAQNQIFCSSDEIPACCHLTFPRPKP